MLASIAGISLLVGGIGIFSVMQISISERTYEIGLRKSIGATDPEIFGQFLIESVSLSLVGGLLGSALGYGITLLAGQAFPDGLAVSPLALVPGRRLRDRDRPGGGRLPGAAGLAPHAGRRDPRRVAGPSRPEETLIATRYSKMSPTGKLQPGRAGRASARSRRP